MKTERIPCKECGSLILPSTSKATGGLCMPCKKGGAYLTQEKGLYRNNPDSDEDLDLEDDIPDEDTELEEHLDALVDQVDSLIGGFVLSLTNHLDAQNDKERFIPEFYRIESPSFPKDLQINEDWGLDSSVRGMAPLLIRQFSAMYDGEYLGMWHVSVTLKGASSSVVDAIWDFDSSSKEEFLQCVFKTLDSSNIVDVSIGGSKV